MLRRKWWLLALVMCLAVLAGVLMLTYRGKDAEELPRGTLVWEETAYE